MITNRTYQQLHDNVTMHLVTGPLLKILYLIPNVCQFLTVIHSQQLKFKLIKYYGIKYKLYQIYYRLESFTI